MIKSIQNIKKKILTILRRYRVTALQHKTAIFGSTVRGEAKKVAI